MHDAVCYVRGMASTGVALLFFCFRSVEFCYRGANDEPLVLSFATSALGPALCLGRQREVGECLLVAARGYACKCS